MEKILNSLRRRTRILRKVLDYLLFHFYLKHRNDWSILDPFKNRHVLVAGNGPSLNRTPLDKIKDSWVSIGMNKINLIYESTSWRPEIITCVNGLVLRQNKAYFNHSEAVIIVPVRAWYLGVKTRPNVLFVNLKDEEILQPNIEKSLSAGCTVTFTALQVAAYLNPKSVNIVGVDHSFSYSSGEDHEIKKHEGEDVNHFSKDYFKGQYWGIPNLDGSERLYQISKNYFDKNRIPIKDLTVGGKLEIFEKEDISTVI